MPSFRHSLREQLAHKGAQLWHGVGEQYGIANGSSAPSIKAETWLRGEPIAHLRPGKVYVVEFWAAETEPCTAAMRHLMQLQEQFRYSGFQVVGVATPERASTDVEAGSRAGRVVDQKTNLKFPIAFDYKGELSDRRPCS
ncbi:TlpA disulfide reductase family protein [Mesorhizobium sp. M0968]|uniref:TlpA disulfide reductase family protein n=1 Tax=Mesorhizobium sp. M0968 TaxID=2957037 RepID=UPI00333C3F85